jgi:nitrogen fixation protein FixH
MKPGMAWPIGITTILATTIAANLWVMRIANNDPAFAIEPDYYRKAVQFDSTMADARRTLALGWGVSAALGAIDDGAHATLTVTLRDSTAAPLRGAHVSAMARFNARANDSVSVVLRETSPGTYHGALLVAHAGEWEVRIDATRGAAHYTHVARVTATPATVAK